MRQLIATSILVLCATAAADPALAAPAELEAWYLNTSGLTGYNGFPANIQMFFFATSRSTFFISLT